MSANLAKRIAVAAIGIPSAFGLVYVGGWPLAALIAFLGAGGTVEMFRLAREAGGTPLTSIGMLGAILAPLVVLALLLDLLTPVTAIGVLVAWVLAILSGAVFRLAPTPATIASVTVTLFGPLYAAALPSALLWLRHGVAGLEAIGATWLVFFPLAMTWICDTFAMAGGSMLGGPKLAPVVSPNKTWSGALSGLVGSTLVAVVFSLVVFPRYELGLTLGGAVAIGLAVGVLGQIGDLAESLFKRSVRVKDSGTFFPGHGGVLDRMDSLYWSLPITAFGLVLVGVL